MSQLGDAFVNSLVGQHLVLFFSDNLYVASRVSPSSLIWYSLDGSKMESSHLLDDIIHNCRFISRMWGSDHDL